MSQAENTTYRTIKGNKFAYDGESHTINGYLKSSPAAISEELRRQPVVAYLKAQRIFWGWSLPELSVPIYKHEMMEELERFCNGGESPPFRHAPLSIFSELEREWNMKNASSSTNTGRKRGQDDVPMESHGESSRKRARVTGIPKASTADRAQPLAVALLRPARNQPDCQAPVVKTEQRVETELQPDGLGPVWKSRWQQDIEKYRFTDYHSRIAGKYAISCPVIEQRYPGLEGKLVIRIRILHSDTKHQGMFEADIDLGLFKGSAAMGIDEHSLADWCYRQQMQLQPTEKNMEIKRLEDEANDAHLSTCGNPCIRSSQYNARSIKAKCDISKCAKLFMQVRLKDEKDLFMRQGAILGCEGEIEFHDLHGLEFEGDIDLPMLGPDPVKFRGYKVKQLLKSDVVDTLWGKIPTSAIKYGDAWNKA
ncbi:hypothetical protein HBH50_046620 [Parastagonospora nodorum]|nr:hypothetical protein HBH50_046620 [Parastagonospora nodorum]KAH4082008.1 hypothetical protein HBH48_188530 [Parastagonospora nodorum]